ncbi:hypothetical protein B9Q01_09275 [Candidatus Marsarchaeota G1 archaeon OSP_D]|uniref:FAD-dependent oxidoreductase 2 FAD-binding domain-containing protein n=2 Tax=Candidatus Marsarchaeota group 1 TaxID=2203770 RepID=A0A2R6A6N8_9ARCH|nr:MAG: hypothetical protein B9Q01_09275 [Candidatus Marsarchaeota G1 archaeon OSP_D]PSN85104.1 MAG: hypothetical protein B9Q00_11230 [Candidatus Marsarchaeota G1 archaeon OSP_C]
MSRHHPWSSKKFISVLLRDFLSKLSNTDIDIAIVGGGGSGLIAALAASQKASSIAVFESTQRFGGHTLMTESMIPAAASKFQKENGIEDSPWIMFNDILRANGGDCNRELVRTLCEKSATVVEWLSDFCNIDFELVTDFLYPGHSRHRMHSTQNRTGEQLIQKIVNKINSMGNIYLLSGRRVIDLIIDEHEVKGIKVLYGKDTEEIRAKKVILASGGYGANRKLLEKYCKEAKEMDYFGNAEHRGDAVIWGEKIGAGLRYMDSYQAHSAVSKYGILITWKTMMNGGIMVNEIGERFADETMSYSSFARYLIKQPNKRGFEIYDKEIHYDTMKFEEYRKAVHIGAVISSESAEGLARALGLNEKNVIKTIEEYNSYASGVPDKFGRIIRKKLIPPFFGVEVYPALFHTQGGLAIDINARVLSNNSSIIPNLYAVGDAAEGISGHGASGYLTGNGLLCATVLGFIAGTHSTNQL